MITGGTSFELDLTQPACYQAALDGRLWELVNTVLTGSQPVIVACYDRTPSNRQTPMWGGGKGGFKENTAYNLVQVASQGEGDILIALSQPRGGEAFALGALAESLWPEIGTEAEPCAPPSDPRPKPNSLPSFYDRVIGSGSMPPSS